MAKMEEMTEAPKKVVLTILDEQGRTKNHSLMELNRDAQGIQSGAKKRRLSIMKRITEFVGQELKQA
jgi:hypothetical protein